MVTIRKKLRLTAAVATVILAGLLWGPAPPATAAGEDVAMFYDELAQYGNWIDYANYGPVWSPSNVSPNWRPYTDGRWVPTSEGWTFETWEPWGWATYHFGNWMPTRDYGWVWSPGSTWYPSTTAWRTSDSYVGWAPIPPPNYVPEPAFYPGGGYVPGTPVLDLLTAPFWIFAQAANFLLGFGQPFVPSYSYYNCGCLAPFKYGPVVYGSTFLLTDFYYPGYAPSAYYCFGPPFPFVSRVTNVNLVQINNFVSTAHFNNFRSGLPPAGVLQRHAFLREAIPGAVREGRRFEVHRVENIAQAERRLNHPGVTPAPGNLPRLTKEIPKVMVAPGRARLGRAGQEGVRGMGLPAQATRAETRQMNRQMRQEQRLRPQAKAPQRMETLPEFRHPSAGQLRPQTEVPRPVPSREFRAAPSRKMRPTPETGLRPGPELSRPMPSREFRATTEARPAPRREFRGVIPQREFRAPKMPQEFRQAPRPEFRAAPAPRSAPTPAPRSAPAPAPRPRS